MHLNDYVGALTRRWLMVVAATLLGGVAAFAVTTQITPQYTSSSGVFVSSTPRDASTAVAGGELAQQRAASYANVVAGLDLAQSVVDRLGLDESAEDLAARITATVVPETVVLRVSVTDPSPQRASEINQAVLEELRGVVDRLETPRGADRPLLEAKVVDEPRVPTEPSSPQPLLNTALGALVGLLLGIGLAILRELRDFGVRTPDEVPALAGVPLLGSVAFDPDVDEHPMLTDLPSNAPRTEAFRVLATNLAFVDVDQPSTVVVITSSVAEEGKSTTAANAAAALAATGKRVLLVDADLRRPTLASLLGLEKAVGLSSVLVGSVSLEEAVQVHEASGTDVVTSGRVPPNPVALLQSESMARFLETAKSTYDIVLVDAPPLLPVTDSALLCSQANGAVIVVRHGQTTRDQVSAAVDRLSAVDVAPVGVVMSMVRRTGRGVAEAYSYGYSPTATELADDVRRRSGG